MTAWKEEWYPIMEKAIELLTPFNKEELDHDICYYQEQDEHEDCVEEFSSEHDTCSNRKCVNEQLEHLKSEYPNKNIAHVWMNNNGDHESFGRCAICDTRLNEWLTWAREEVEHHLEYTTTLNDFKSSTNSFELIAIFQSMPTNDYQPSNWCKANKENPYEDQEKFYFKVVDYAKTIIKALEHND